MGGFNLRLMWSVIGGFLGWFWWRPQSWDSDRLLFIVNGTRHCSPAPPNELKRFKRHSSAVMSGNNCPLGVEYVTYVTHTRTELQLHERPDTACHFVSVCVNAAWARCKLTDRSNMLSPFQIQDRFSMHKACSQMFLHTEFIFLLYFLYVCNI